MENIYIYLILGLRLNVKVKILQKKSQSRVLLRYDQSSFAIIKDHCKNFTLHPLVENPSSFAGSSIRSEKDNSIIFQEVKAKPEARQTNNFTNNLTEQKYTSNKDRSEHSLNKISKKLTAATTTATTTTATTK